MSAEEIRETVTEVWPHWQGTVINGAYPLRRILQASEHSAVFLSEYPAHDPSPAAIKIVPAERVTLAQLAHWRTATGLSHPHLIRLLDAGLYQLGARQFLFVVMEYADQTLAQVLPQRALSADEVREMLLPTLDALTFLHRQNLVQGQLKPANFLVVGDQLKLASDTVRPAGEPRASSAPPCLYDPPEARDGALSAAGDIWGLGVTMVEALTQGLPWPDEHSGITCLPPTLPPAFVDTIRRCLSHDPAGRPTAAELQAEFTGAPDVPVVEAPRAVVRDTAAPAAPPAAAPRERARRSSRAPALAASAFLVVLIITWAGMRLFHAHPDARLTMAPAAPTPAQRSPGTPLAAAPNPGTSVPAPAESPAAAVSAKSRPSRPPPRAVPARAQRAAAPPLPDAAPSVLHEQMPVAARSALRTIHGHVKVAVLVVVDPSGKVTETRLENPGPSAYFARLAKEAAGQWQFAAADAPGSRQWLLRFEFTSSGATGHATPR